ncbi:MAG: HAD hydrolase-like protein, partial [bacterium]|nr:HAD hydrolase-like protein [bacterium]
DDFWNQVCHRLGVTKEQFSLFSKKSLKIDMNEELWDYLPKLKKRYKLAILSNIGTNKMSLIKNTIDLSIFDEVRFSAEVGKDKSEDEFFLELSRALGFLPCEILFVDDTLRHIEKEKNLGFGNYLFGDLIGLKKVIDEN